MTGWDGTDVVFLFFLGFKAKAQIDVVMGPTIQRHLLKARPRFGFTAEVRILEIDPHMNWSLYGQNV